MSHRSIITFLQIMLAFKILGFATIADSAAVAKVLKIILGLLTTSGVVILIIMMSSKGLKPFFQVRKPLPAFMYIVYLLLGTISLFWANDFMFAVVQLFRDYDLLVFSILCIMIIEMVNQDGGKYTLSKVLMVPVLLNVLVFLVGYFVAYDTFMRLTHGGDVARLGGYIMNPNELGMLSSFGMICVVLELRRVKAKWFWILAIAAMFAVMFLTGSRSSLIGFMLACGILLMQIKNTALKVIMLAGGIALGTVAAQKVIFAEDKGGVDEVMSMTGRLPFWKALITEALPKEPMLGYGFMNIYYTKFFQGRDTYPASMTHNTFVQVLMNLGFIGISIVISQMTFTFQAVISNKDRTQKQMFFLLFIPLIINSLTEFGIWGETNYGILFYQMLFLNFVIEGYNKLDNKMNDKPLSEKMIAHKPGLIFKQKDHPLQDGPLYPNK